MKFSSNGDLLLQWGSDGLADSFKFRGDNFPEENMFAIPHSITDVSSQEMVGPSFLLRIPLTYRSYCFCNNISPVFRSAWPIADTVVCSASNTTERSCDSTTPVK